MIAERSGRFGVVLVLGVLEIEVEVGLFDLYSQTIHHKGRD